MPLSHLIYEPLIIPKRYNISYDLLIPWNLTLAPQHEDSGAQEEDTQEHYDPIAAATEGWGDDGTRPVRYDPIAAATEGWGDDGTKPVRYDSVTSEKHGDDDDESQQAHYDPMAEAQAGWDDDESQPVTEVAAAEDVAPAAETPTEAPPEAPAEEEASQADAALDDEEGQVIQERKKKKVERCIWTKNGGCIEFFEEEVWTWGTGNKQMIDCELKGGKVEKS